MDTCACRFVIASTIATVLGPPAVAEDVWIENVFGTAHDSMNMTEIERRAYAMGIVNGGTLAPLFSATQRLAWSDADTDTMFDRKAERIIFEYIADNPQSWAAQLHVLKISAIRQACDARAAASRPGF